MPTHRLGTILCVLAATSAVASAVHAQDSVQTLSQLYHTVWTMRDGAPGAVEALAQTADGYLWLGTGTGLFRFDGVRFEAFEAPAGQTMPSLNVSALLATRDSGLWVGYRFGGVSLIRGGVIHSYGERDSLLRGTILQFEQDRDGAIWIGTTVGIARLDGNRWHTLGPREGLPVGPVTAILADRQGRMWASADSGVFMRSSGGPRGAGAPPRHSILPAWTRSTRPIFRRRRTGRSGDRRRKAGCGSSRPRMVTERARRRRTSAT